MALQPGSRIGPYEDIALIGEGASASVSFRSGSARRSNIRQADRHACDSEVLDIEVSVDPLVRCLAAAKQNPTLRALTDAVRAEEASPCGSKSVRRLDILRRQPSVESRTTPENCG
jgi:hypothetical protein